MKKSDADTNAENAAGGANTGSPYTDLGQEPCERKKPGFAPTGRAKVLINARIPGELVYYVNQWKSEADAQGMGEALTECLTDARKFVPRPGFERERAAGGRWVSTSNKPPRPTRTQLEAENRRLKERLRAAGLEVE